MIVPSGSLRDHVAGALVRRHGRALVALRVQTLHAAALEILERTGETPGAGAPLFPIVVRQLARGDASLRRALDPLLEGYAIVAAAVGDLLDAGLEPSHARELARVAQEQRGAAGTRARAVLRVALAVLERMRELGLESASGCLTRAASVLRLRGTYALPSRTLWIHGFAEATGRASELIEVLVHQFGARVILDHPPSPTQPESDDPGIAFSARLRSRLDPVATVERARGPGARPRLRFLGGPGADAEVRAVGQRILSLLEGGAVPERIGVVSRVLDPYTLPLRKHFGRLGIPFSARERAGPPIAAGRRVQALIELLADGDEIPVDRWLDTLGAVPELGSRRRPEPRRHPLRRDLSLGLHSLGSGRLRDVAELDLALRLGDEPDLPLPVRRGLAYDEAPDDANSGPRARRRRLPRRALEAAVRHARELSSRLASWPERSSLASWLEELGELLDQLGFCDGVPGHDETRDLLDRLRTELPSGFALDRAELVWLIEQQLRDTGRAPLGGAGGGVQVLDVVEARARTFEHLFVLGANRDVFPRIISEDPLLRDDVRTSLAAVLPEMPIKRSGHDEESYLFAQLLSASPEVTLSWQTITDDGAARAPSSFVERLLLADPEARVELAPPLWVADAASSSRPAHEHAVLAGLHGAREHSDRVLAVAIEVESPPARVRPRLAARARILVGRERDPDLRRPGTLGPYFGFVGPIAEREDTRRAELWVTTLERYAGCPWQMLLTRLLRIEATPDALDALPSLEPRLVGAAVHSALEAIVGLAGVECHGDLAAVSDRPAVAVPWPDREALDRILIDAARAALLDCGVELPGLARALAERSREYVERARALLWPDGAGLVLAAEARGTLSLEDALGQPRSISFRADLVEPHDGHLRLTDYKTGRPISDARTRAARRARLLERVASGRNLQAPAYRVGADADGGYLFLQPDLDSAAARVPALRDDEELGKVFRETASLALAGLGAGVFFPRLLQPDRSTEPVLCRYCEVAEACLRGDSGATRRLAIWTGAADPEHEGEAEALFQRLWRLGAKGRGA